jgi:superfamily II DNA or RNA helicase
VTHNGIALILSPRGHLVLEQTPDSSRLDPDFAARLEGAFGRGQGHGLLQLGAGEVQTATPAEFAFWREFASRYIVAVRTLPNIADVRALPAIPPLSPDDLEEIAASAPAMKGAEYLTPALLKSLWNDIDTAFRQELSQEKVSVEDFLKQKDPAWNLVGRVYFNLAENRNDPEAPFAFLATYTHALSAQAKAQHMPLGRALTEYAGAANKQRLLSLLLPVQRAAARCGWLKAMVDSGEIYHPLRWTPAEAFQLLNDLPALESAGVIVRMPTAWRGGRAARPQVAAKVGTKPAMGIGTEALLDFSMEITLDGELLTAAEVAELLHSSTGLHLLRGRWIEVDREKLAGLIEQFRRAEAAAAEGGLTFAKAMRLVAGADTPAGSFLDEEENQEWSRVVAGEWLRKTLAEIRHPESAPLYRDIPLRTELRPYQETGVRWLHLLSTLGLGACLADDMGLGKTMQVLALLLVLRKGEEHNDDGQPRRTSLLVAPASLLANWRSEIQRFAPDLTAVIAHASTMSVAELRRLDAKLLANVDLVITSYGSLLRIPELLEVPWRLAVIDEAQAIKNPAAKQTRLVKQLDAHARIALTGTPVENRIGDLWSIFDFINPGLLGSAKDFTKFTKRLAERPRNPYAPLRELVRPYILRRLKTDKTVIHDLPQKTEVKAFCQLTRKQAALYQESVKELARRLDDVEEGIERRGMVLSFLMRFKQICNHPSQWLGNSSWAEADSGKLARLRELVEVIESRQEKVLVFTQFREITDHLKKFLDSVFRRPGLVLHGETDVRQRQSLVRQFQEDERIPFFVLSLKAGGVGLNLTAASHVIHFDRWWNPAVENQATDRAFRIGQTKNVLVQKFICRGTVEEKIDALLESKQELSRDLLEGGADLLLTELSDEELLSLVALDLNASALE